MEAWAGDRFPAKHNKKHYYCHHTSYFSQQSGWIAGRFEYNVIIIIVYLFIWRGCIWAGSAGDIWGELGTARGETASATLGWREKVGDRSVLSEDESAIIALRLAPSHFLWQFGLDFIFNHFNCPPSLLSHSIICLHAHLLSSDLRPRWLQSEQEKTALDVP